VIIVYGGGDSSTEGETLRRGKIVYVGGDYSTEGGAGGGLLYGGGDSFMEGRLLYE
jgi:hypothetical protein